MPYGCERDYHAAGRRVAESKQCPLGKLSVAGCFAADPFPIRNVDDLLRGFKALAAADMPVPALSGAGVVTCGERHYWPGIVVMVKLLRDVLKCDVPVKVYHRTSVGPELDGYDVQLFNTTDMQSYAPAHRYDGWAAKSYAVINSGFERVLFLDADAYLVRNPQPLFDALDECSYGYWADWNTAPMDYARKWLIAHGTDRLQHANGGEYVVNLRTWWKQYNLIRYLDNHADIWYNVTRNWYGDEGSNVFVRSWERDRAVRQMAWVKRSNGVGIIGEYQGIDYLCHRMRPEAKLFPGTVPRRCSYWPLEAEVFNLFAGMDWGYAQRREEQAAARTPRGRRRARERALGRY